MCCQSQSDLIVANVNVWVMVHFLGQLCNSIDELDSLHEIFEDIELGYAAASKLPAFECLQLGFDLALLQPQLYFITR